MANIYADPKDIIPQIDASVYRTNVKPVMPDSTGISNYGLAKLVEQGAQLDEANMIRQQEAQTAAANEQRSVLAELAAAMNNASESRKQNLDYLSKDQNIPKQPIAAEYGILSDPSVLAKSDALNEQSVLASIAKTRAEATEKSNPSAKLKTKLDEFGRPTFEYGGDMSPEMIQELRQKQQNAAKTSSLIAPPSPLDVPMPPPLMGEHQIPPPPFPPELQQKAAAAAAPVKIAMPSGKSATLTDVQPVGDGTFVGTVMSKGGQPAKVRIREDGSYAGRAE